MYWYIVLFCGIAQVVLQFHKIFEIIRRMGMRKITLVAILLIMLLAGCQTGEPSPEPTRPFVDVDWNKAPEAVIVRVDDVVYQPESRVHLSEIPLCTVYGDGRVIWLSTSEQVNNQALEGTISEEEMLAFINFVIEQGFYSWITDQEDPMIPTDFDPRIPYVEMNLIQDQRRTHPDTGQQSDVAVSEEGYEAIIQRCMNLIADPVLVWPRGGWLHVYPANEAYNPARALWRGGESVRLADAAASGGPVWIEGDLARDVWNTIHDSGNFVYIEDARPYFVAMQVPGVTRDSPPPPDGWVPPDFSTPTPPPTEEEIPEG
jgi:hypothetical protein